MKPKQWGWYWVYHDQLPHYFKIVTVSLYDDENKQTYKHLGLMAVDEFGDLFLIGTKK